MLFPSAMALLAAARSASMPALRPSPPGRHVVERRQGDALEPVRAGATVEVAQLLQLLVAEHRRGQADLARRGGRRLQQVPLGADGGVDRHDDLFADGVHRRVGHLGEQLLEVAVEQLRLVRQHRQRRVGPHRAVGLDAVDGHGRHQHLEVLAGVAEGLLAPQHGVVIGLDHRRRLGQIADGDQVLLQPLPVGGGGRHLVLDLVVADDPALRGVDQEHAPRLQTPLLQNPLGRNVEHADLGRHHDQVVLGDVVARRAQAVAVERGADAHAVGEGHRGGTVPGLHQAAVELVEVLPGARHRLVVRPRLGDHHHHRVRQRPPCQKEQLEDVVEHPRVRPLGVDDRDALLQVVAEQLGGEHALAGVHPVDVAAQRVDLAVVGDHPVGMRARPVGEGVGRKPRVHQRQRRLDALVLQVEIERGQLIAVQHPLVDDGSRGEAGDVEARLLGDLQAADRVASAPADDVELPLEGVVLDDRRVTGDEELLDDRLRLAGGRPQHPAVDRDLAPAEHALPLVTHDLLEQVLAGGPAARIAGQEHHPDAVVPDRGERDVPLGLGAGGGQEVVRDLDEDAGAVAGVLFRPARTAVLEVEEYLDPVPDDLVGLASLQIDNEANPA